MAIGNIGILGGGNGVECEECGDMKCRIDCNDGSLEACFEGKCITVSSSGFGFIEADIGCSKCTDANTSIHCPLFATAPLSCDYVFSGSLEQCSGGGFANSKGFAGVWIRFPSTGSGEQRVIQVGTQATYGNLGTSAFGANALFGISGYEGSPEWDEIQTIVNALCAGGSASVPFISKDEGACSYSGSTISISLSEEEECSNPTEAGYNCVDGACRQDTTGGATYATIGECMAAGCSTPPTFNCLSGVCTDPGNGTGIYGSMEDCVASGCGAPVCSDLAGCTLTKTAEITGFVDCNDGTYDWLYSNLNRVYSLPGNVGRGIDDPFHLDLGTLGDYGDPGILIKQKIVVGGVHEEEYVHAIELIDLCTDGQVNNHQVDFYYARYAWTEPDAPTLTHNSSFGYNPTSVVEATAAPCHTLGSMVSIYDYSDCLSVSRTFVITSSVG